MPSARKQLNDKLVNGSFTTYDEMIDFLISPEIRPLVIQIIIEKERKLPCVELAGGIDVPEYLVADLMNFVDRWPGAVIPNAMPGVVIQVLHRFKKGPKL